MKRTKHKKRIRRIRTDIIPKKTSRDKRLKGEITEFMCELALSFTLLGATNERLSKVFSVSIRTIDRWIEQDEKFGRAVKEGRDESVAKVVRGVYNRAIGYTRMDTTKARRVIRGINGAPVLDEEGKQQYEMVVISKTTKHFQPDIAAAKFYMFNRTKMNKKEDRWHDSQHFDHSSSDGTMSPKEIINANMDPKEAARMYQQMIKDSR